MDVASKQQKTLKNVLYYGLPVLAILMIAVGWVLFSGSHPELMPAPADVWARFVKTFTKPIAKTSLAGHAWASLRRVLMALLIAWIFAGIRTSVSSGWTTVLAAEMLGAQKGLGALVTRGWQGSDMALVLVSVITIAIIGALLSLGLQKLEKVVCPWNN